MRNWLICLIFFSVLYANNPCYAEEKSVIDVELNKELGEVNRNVFGTNFIGYDPTTFEKRNQPYYGYSDYGAGVWDSKWNNSIKDIIVLAKEIGVSSIRFPGGMAANSYHWKDGVGKNRQAFLFGIDEFLKTCGEINAKPIFTINYFDSITEAQELVKYLNLPSQKIEFFEIGNEIWDGNLREVKYVSPDNYAKRYLEFYKALKSIDPNLKIGVVLYGSGWNKTVLSRVKEYVDFGIFHIYPSPEGMMFKSEKKSVNIKDIFKLTFASFETRILPELNQISALLKSYSGSNIPLAITEFNGGFTQQNPVPFRHCLGNALSNALLLDVLLKQGNNILMANYWQFCNSYFGIVANRFDGTFETLYNQYYKRPNYYIFEMYHKHFGDILINANVKCATYDVGSYSSIKSFIKRFGIGSVITNNLISGRWIIRDFAGVDAKENDGILSVTFIKPVKFDYFHARKTVVIEPGSYYKLSGYIKTDELVDEIGVSLEAQDARGWNLTKSAAETERVKGTTDWQYVEVIYETLADAKAVNVLARRDGETGPLKGKVYFKDVKFEKFIPSLDTKIPYLCVNTSKSKDGKKVFLMVINKNIDGAVTTLINLNDFKPAAKANAWTLNGPGVDALNEDNHNNVKITHKAFKITSDAIRPDNSANQFEYTFEPHSLTAIELDRE